uniref:ribonuclease H n=1 Tax=Oryzias sinensis TaxID=183150 RepID=A0A8C8DHP6_9TELE
MFGRRGLSVLALSETKMKGKGECVFGSVSGRMSGVESGRAREGVALLVSCEVRRCVVEWKEVSPRLMWVKVKFQKELWVFVSAYGPGSERNEEERVTFWNDLDECLQGFGANVNVVLMGDLNARVGDERIEGVVGGHGVPGKNDNGERLIGMCTEREMVIGNTWFRKKEIHKYTWVRQSGGRVIDKALMDYVVVSKVACSRLLDVSVRRGESGGMSDHYLVEGRLRVGMPWVRSRKSGEARKVLRVSVLKNREKMCEYQRELGGKWNMVKEQMVVGVEEEWQQFKSAVVGSAEKVCGVRHVGGGLRKGSEWWCEDVRLAVAEKRCAYEVWLQRKDRESYECYKEKKRDAKRAVREARAAADERWGRQLTDNFRENKKMFWKEVKRVRKGVSGREEKVKTEDGRMLNEGNAVRKRWAEYFERLLNVEEDRDAVIGMDGRESRLNVLEELNEALITGEEVEQAVGKLKVGKAAGVDGCAVECLKCGGAIVIEWLVRLLNVCFANGQVPLDWMSACVVPLYKGKGDKYECGSFRGISLLSVVGKVYGRVLINRVVEGTECMIGEEQCGFRRGRGCVDQVFVVRQVCEKFLAKGREVFWAFMDLEKAYDRIDREALWVVLSMYGIDGSLLEGVKSFYRNSRACVRVGNSMSEWFPVRVGLRQGCVMSPWLFNVYMDGVVKEVNERVSGTVVSMMKTDGSEWSVNQLLFADDTALVADSEESLARLVEEFGRVCDRRKLRVNVEKSKVMRCTRVKGERRLNVALNGELLEEVECFQYLGSCVCVDGGIGGEVEFRMNEVRKIWGGMKRVFECRSLGKDAKRRLYEGVVVPAALYGAETWSLKVAEKRKLNVVEMRCLRSMCGVTRMDRVRNEVIRERTGVMRELADRAEQKALGWFGHVERMGRERLVKRVYESDVSGVRMRGRPRMGWTEGVRRALNARGMTVVQGREAAQDRDGWRELVYE